MAARVPQLYTWIEWWHDRGSHIFGPYRGGGLPGCNLSEQGNAKWQPTNTMRLTHAAHNDVSTIIFQEVSVNLFNRNLHKSLGRGRSKAARDVQDRAQQMNVVNDFIETLNNPQAFLEHITEILQPSSHTPKGRASFKPSKKKTSKDDYQQNQRNDKRKGRKQKINIPPTSASLDKLEHKAKQAEKVIAGTDVDENEDETNDDSNTGKRRANQQPNLPVVIFTDGLWIQICQGCGKGIIPDQQLYPSNMVFQRRGIRSIYNKKYKRICNKEQNNHYHLNRSCIHQKDKTVEYRDIIMNDETFEALSVEQMKVLNGLGFLIFIVEDKKKQM